MHMKQLCRHSAPTTILHPFASHVKPPHTYRNNNNRLNSIRAAMGTKHPKENFYQESCNPCGVIGWGGGGYVCVWTQLQILYTSACATHNESSTEQ